MCCLPMAAHKVIIILVVIVICVIWRMNKEN